MVIIGGAAAAVLLVLALIVLALLCVRRKRRPLVPEVVAMGEPVHVQQHNVIRRTTTIVG
jgi:MYXO-CTERM domain-containing protein